ncbi:MAG: hypothetical protein UHK44_01645 [Bacteroidaceae bacterium]|nr:hypothetical protein [Bacteroidaceae bacterium]
MKNKLFLSLGVVMAMFVTSCSNEELSVSSQEGLSQVRLSVAVGNEHATRAISDGKGVDKLVYAVFDENQEIVVKKTEVGDVSDFATGHSIVLPLKFGKTYTAVFWAQDADCAFYDVSDAMEVTVDYSGSNNDETRDAFFASETFTVNSLTFSKEVVLRRPFAQVNVGSYKYEVEMAEKLGFKVSKSAATIKDVPNKLNLVTGATSGKVDVDVDADPEGEPANNRTNPMADNETEGVEDVNYGSAAVPDEALLVDVNGDGVKDEFTYLSMSYVLADGDENGTLDDTEGRTTHEMSFTFTDANGNEIVFNQGLQAVPIQRNWRTNIVGQVLSNEPIEPGVSFNVKLDPQYIDDEVSNNGFFYIYDQNTTIEDKDFVFNSLEHSAEFGTPKGTDDIDLTYKNVSFRGNIGYISFGVYNTGTPNNFLEEVSIENLTINSKWGITNNKRCIAFGAYFYGNNQLKNCTLKGTKIDGPKNVDGKYINQANLVLDDYFDCAFVNFAKSTIDGGEYGRIYNYEHAQTTVTGDAHISEIVTTTFKTHGGYLRIEGGTVDKITVNPTFLSSDSYQPIIIIEAGATVKEIDFNGKKATDVVNNSGKTIIYTNVAP